MNKKSLIKKHKEIKRNRKKISENPKNKQKRGFSLIELLAAIAIISIIFGIGTLIFTNVIDKSKKNSVSIAMDNLKEAAYLYGKEKADEIHWDTFQSLGNEETLFVCMTVQELINEGYFKDEFYKNSNYDEKINENTFIKLSQTKSYSDLTVEIFENSSIDQCKALPIPTPEIIIDPDDPEEPDGPTDPNDPVSSETNIPSSYDFQIDDSTNYSDRAIIKISPFDEDIKDKVHYTGLINGTNFNCTGGNCTFTGLKSEQTYIYEITMEPNTGTEYNFKSKKSFSLKTAPIIKPSITISSSTTDVYTIKFSFNDNNIYNSNGYHYFKLGVAGTANTNVTKCAADTNKNNNTCTSTGTKTIEKNSWYFTTADSITVTTASLTSSGGSTFNLYATTQDETKNKADDTDSFTVPKHTTPTPTTTPPCTINITYNLNGGTNHSNNKTSYTQSNTTITLQNPTKKGYTFTSWNGISNNQINLNTCKNYTITANWKRNFTCASAGGTTTYMNHSWYTNSNANGYCDLSLNGTAGTGTYNENTTKVYNAIKGYSNGINTLEEEKNAGLVDQINTISGTGNASNISGFWWHNSGKVYYNGKINVYSLSSCDYYFSGGFKTDPKNSSRDGKGDVTRGRYCKGLGTTTHTGSVPTNNATASHTYTNTSYTNPKSGYISAYVNIFKYQKKSGSNVYFTRTVHNMKTDGTWGDVALAAASAKGKDGKTGCKEHYNTYKNTTCPKANGTTTAKKYHLKGCGGLDVTGVTSGTYIFAGGANYIYGKNDGDRTLTAYDGGNNYNAPKSNCEQFYYYTISGSRTITYSYRPHIRVKM
ncbi:MAG: InlB B-repeat-containing protein [Bacilli bacterium]|nr:InlB B-repeat-containing protein [Bacilli bacterium]